MTNTIVFVIYYLVGLVSTIYWWTDTIEVDLWDLLFIALVGWVPGPFFLIYMAGKNVVPKISVKPIIVFKRRNP